MIRRAVMLLVIGALALAACGGDGGGTTDTTGGGSDGAGNGDGGGGAPGVLGAAQCAEMVQAMAAAAGAAGVAATGGGEDIQGSTEQLEAFAAAAPEEIRDDMQTIAEGYGAFAQVLADSGYDPTSQEPPPPEVIAALTQAAEQLQAAEFQAAVERVNTYFEQECGG